MLRRLGLLVAALSLAACQQTYVLGPRAPLRSAYLSVYPLTGSPSFYPTAISAGDLLETRAEVSPLGTVSFDLAFDTAPSTTTPGATDIRVIPARAFLVAPTLGVPEVGLLRSGAATFEAATEAPTDGYSTDSVLTVRIGETFFARLRPPYCRFQFNPLVYVKAVVDSLDPVSREIQMRVVQDPNCGQRRLSLDNFPRR
jgi:hypothetical protein